MEQTTASSADQHYAESFKYFTRGMSKLFERNPQEHGLLADELGAYVRRFDSYARGHHAEVRGFDAIYSKITQLSGKLNLQPEYVTRWLFDSYKGHDNFMRKLQGAVPSRQPLGKPRPRGSDRKQPFRVAARV